MTGRPGRSGGAKEIHRDQVSERGDYAYKHSNDEQPERTRMDGMALTGRILSKLEVAALAAMQVLMIVIVLAATVILYLLLVKNLLTHVTRIESVDQLIPTMQQSFAGVLTVVLGLELLETLRTYFTEHHVRLEVILVIAIIAVSRHVIQVDFEHTSGPVLFGLSGVILALTTGYFLIKKAQVAVTANEPVGQAPTVSAGKP